MKIYSKSFKTPYLKRYRKITNEYYWEALMAAYMLGQVSVLIMVAIGYGYFN